MSSSQTPPPPSPGGQPSPPPGPDLPSPVAARTYSAIRMGVVAVIFALGVAVARDIYNAGGHCVQRSLSAYFYTPVGPVFIGALLIIGFAMIAIWGKTAVEDAALNLAGLLIAAVALVPTLDNNYCSLPADVRDQIPDDATQNKLDEALILANAPNVHSNFFTFLVTVSAILVVVAITGVVLYRRAEPSRRPSKAALIAYTITWSLAAIAVVVYVVLYQDADDVSSDFNHNLHGWSANIGVSFVIVAVAAAAVQKARSNDTTKPWLKRWQPRWWNRWVWIYGLLALAMVVAAAVFKLGGSLLPDWWDSHSTFLLEAIVILLLAVFWVLQTIDRWDERAPRY